MTKIRLFFALETPDAVRTEVAVLLRTLQDSGADVRWEPIEKLHCTIRFLGDTDPGMVMELGRVSSALASSLPAPRVRYRGVGGFPNLRRPRVVWVGMEDIDGTLAVLHGKLEGELSLLGLEAEARAFHPHLTLGRLRGERKLDHLIRLLESATLKSQPVILTDLLLMRSELRSSGSVYTRVQAFPFQTR